MPGLNCDPPAAPRILPRHQTRYTPFRHCGRNANDSIHRPFLPLFAENERVTRERIDEIRNADHDRTIGINCGSRREYPRPDKGEKNG